MGWKLDTINDPKLRRRLRESLEGAASLQEAIQKAIPHRKILQRQKPLSNKLETAFGDQLHSWYSGVILHEQAITFTIANGVRYTPDWVVFLPQSVQCFEVKGPHVWEDSIVKLKIAARAFPSIQWNLAFKREGRWLLQLVYP